MGKHYATDTQSASAQTAVAATDTTLVAAVTGAKIAVVQVFVMTDTQQTITLEEGSTRLFEAYCAADGGVVLTAPVGEYLWEGTAATALTFTSSANGNAFVHVVYALVP